MRRSPTSARSCASVQAECGPVLPECGPPISKSPSRSRIRFCRWPGFDELSFLYHSLSWSSDVTAEIDERDPYQAQLFAMRAVLAPVAQPIPALLQASRSSRPARSLRGLARRLLRPGGYRRALRRSSYYCPQSRLEVDEQSCGASRCDGRAGWRYQRSSRNGRCTRRCRRSIRGIATLRGEVDLGKQGRVRPIVRDCNPTTVLCVAQDHLLSGPTGNR